MVCFDAEHLPCQSDTSEVVKELGAICNILESMEWKQDTYIATMGAYHRNVAAVLANQQVFLTALLPHLLAQSNAAAPHLQLLMCVCLCRLCHLQHPLTGSTTHIRGGRYGLQHFTT